MIVYVFTSCNNNQSNISTKSLPTMTFDVNSGTEEPVNNIFKSLEVIRMDTIADALVSNAWRIVECQDYFIFQADYRGDIYVFEKNGKYISNSKKVVGQSKSEIFAILGCTYNPHNKYIEVLTPNAMKFYDVNFNFIKSVSLPTKDPKNEDNPADYFDFVYDLSEHEHILLAGGYRGNSKCLYFFDSNSEKVTKKIPFDKEVIVPYSNQNNCFNKYQGKQIAFLPYLTDYIYMLDSNNNQLIPWLKLDFKEKSLTRDVLSSFPTDSKEDRAKRSKFIRESNYHIPMQFAMCESKLYVTVRNSSDRSAWYHLEINTDTKTVKKFKFVTDAVEKFQININSDKNNIYFVCNNEDELSACIKEFGSGNIITDERYNSSEMTNIAVVKYRIK